jgi:hypothetical protein
LGQVRKGPYLKFASARLNEASRSLALQKQRAVAGGCDKAHGGEADAGASKKDYSDFTPAVLPIVEGTPGLAGRNWASGVIRHRLEILAIFFEMFDACVQDLLHSQEFPAEQIASICNALVGIVKAAIHVAPQFTETAVEVVKNGCC